ncbi:MAG: HAD family hydrolase [Chloroflexi bacterium]|nr:HAD family hydrolase [Chloroflexota bacterium]
MRRAVFLDRDGVINPMIYRQAEAAWDSPYTLEEFTLLPGVSDAIASIRRLGFLAVVTSNQPGVAKGRCGAEFLDALNAEMQARLSSEATTALDAIYYCQHHPDGAVPELRRLCECRKPKSGLLLEAARAHDIDLLRSYMVGDRLVDVEAGRGAGCTTILVVQSPMSPVSEGDRQGADHVANDLFQAAELIAQLEKH